MQFTEPWLWLLAAPAAALLLARGAARRPWVWARVATLLLLVALLADPWRVRDREGTDLVVVADRSASMPPGAEGSAREIVDLLLAARRPGDRIGVVSFGARAAVERYPHQDGPFGGFAADVGADGSDLAAALGLALDLLDPAAPGAILVVSDGEATGAPGWEAAELAASRGVPIHHRHLSLPPAPDLAALSVEPPPEVAPNDPFQFAGWIWSDLPARARVRLVRDGALLAEGERDLAAGSNRIVFHDLLATAGVHHYEIEVLPAAGTDRTAANNRARGAVRVLGQPRVLLVNETGEPGVLADALRGAGLHVDVVAPSGMPPDAAGLDPYRGVILENVEAGAVGADRLALLASTVENLGCGLLVTGGRRSFGVGGYFRSPLEPVLPVSMELRQEHRKLAMALAIAMDRSGSMSAPVAAGLVKMDLANAGACAAIEQMGPLDEVAVLAVDTEAHVMVPMGPVRNRAAIVRDVERIASEGGGIFVDVALQGAGEELDSSGLGTRHIILFADAADAEEPGEYATRVPAFVARGITVSVVGLGLPTDIHADFLRDVARLGEGRIVFTQDPGDLPRLFAQEAITVSRSAFVPDPTPCRVLPDLALLGMPTATPPPVGGYNLAYLRPRATAGILTADDTCAPLLSFWHRGLGRSAALACEVEGEHAGEWSGWTQRDEVLVTVARWICGGAPPSGIAARVTREGAWASVEVSLDEEMARTLTETPRWWIVPPDPREPPVSIPLAWTGERTLSGRTALPRPGTYLSLVRWGDDRSIRVPPVTLSYAPEVAPRADRPEGGRLLGEISTISGGGPAPNVGTLLRERTMRSAWWSLQIPVAACAAVLLLLEIAERRAALLALLAGILRRAVRLPRPRTAAPGAPGAPRTAARDASRPSPGSPPADGPTRDTPPAVPGPAAPPPPSEPTSPFARAKERARDRTQG